MDLYIVIPAICATIYSCLAAIALRHPTKTRVVFTAYLLCGAVWSMVSAIAQSGLFQEQTYTLAKLLLISAFPMIIFYYHFVRLLTKQSLGLFGYLGYAVSIAVIVLTARGYFLLDAYYAEGRLQVDYGSGVFNLHIIAAVGFPFVARAMIYLLRQYHTLTDPAARNRFAYLLVGISVFILLASKDLYQSLLRYPIDYAGGIINGVFITYAILKYQLLDIKLVLRKGLIYTALTAFLTGLYFVTLLILQVSFHELTGYRSLALAAVYAVAVAILFNPIRNQIQKWIDRVFYRQTYDYRQMLLHFSNKVSNVLDLNELAHSILEPVVNSMHVKRASLLLPEIASGDFITRFARQGNGDETTAKLKLANDNPIVPWLEGEGKALHQRLIDIRPQFKGLWEIEKTAIKALGIELLCPIRSKGKLIGILALSKKQSDSPYSDEEVDLLMTMANEAGIVMENARMLDSLKAQQLQVEQLLAQVVLAQEEERNRISIDLHDSVAQWLVGASYRLQTFGQIIAGDERAHRELADMEQTVTKSLKELRRVVVGLRPPALDELGLTHALRQSLEELQNEKKDCQFTVKGEPFRLSSSMEIAVYRVVQETLSNIRKHAAASKVKLSLQFQKNRLTVEIGDNGKGFDLNQTLGSAIAVGHMGLLGMKQRAEMMGGNIKINSREGAGTTVTLSLPVQSNKEEK